MTPAGFPHSDTSGSKSARDSPKLFAACHVLHRLLAPRHPPRALCSLTTTATHQAVSCHVARDAPCTQLGEIEDLQSAETYPVVKVGPCGLDRSTVAGPSDPLVGEPIGPRIRGATYPARPGLGPDTKRRLDTRRAAVLTAFASRAAWGVWPRYSVLNALLWRQSVILQLVPRWWRRGDSNS